MASDMMREFTKYWHDQISYLPATKPCDCDFHNGLWYEANGEYVPRHGQALKWAVAGERVKANGGSYCNDPNRTWGANKNDPPTLPTMEVTKATGHNCSKCNSFNGYAESNRPDGSYVCFNCRV